MSLEILFNSYIWSLPLFFIVFISFKDILKNGIYTKFSLVSYKKVNAINVLMFAMLGILGLFSLTRFSGLFRIYLVFCLVFGMYGSGEMFWELINIFRISLDRGFSTWLFSNIYPVFFCLNNVPLIIFLKEQFVINYQIFLFFMVVQFIFYSILFILEGTEKGSKLCQVAYYLARFSAIVGYSIILLECVN